MRTLILLAAVLACTGCQEKKSDLTIGDAKTRAALALSAFECSALAPVPADSSRLFNAGLLAASILGSSMAFISRMSTHTPPCSAWTWPW